MPTGGGRGVMTERSNVIVLKTIMGKPIVGSNPTHTWRGISSAGRAFHLH